MTRKLKALGLALIAMMALGGLTAVSAGANHIDSGVGAGGITHITGGQIGINQFDTPVGPIICGEAKFDATFPGNTKPNGITLKPTYNNCNAFGFPAQIDTNNCGILLTTPTGVNPFDTDHFDAVTHFECGGGGGPIQITVGEPVQCTIDIFPGTPTNPTTDLVNDTMAAPWDIALKWTLEGIHYQTTPPHGSPCGTAGAMKLTGDVTLRAFADAAHMVPVPLWIT
ncbi:MAG TPA: hypothetical protein VFX85_10875 [Solirubrobacterales bacterium]|nr:hypothetical protein [Solirubrobacterales bacterium]